MAAGLGFKDFTTGEVLTAADVDGYLMQGVWVFASAAARDAAVTSPQEGNFAYLKDTNVTTYYTGSAWANLDTTGMTNPMTTTGDMIYSSSGSTPARLGIGSTGNVLTVAGGVPSWAAPASGGGMTLLSTTTLTASGNITISSISQDYVSLMMMVYGVTFTSASPNLYVRINGYSTGHYGSATKLEGASAGATPLDNTAVWLSAGVGQVRQTGGLNSWTLSFPDYTNTSHYKNFEFSGQWMSDASTNCAIDGGGALKQTAAITSFEINTSDTFSTGTVKIWGIK